MSIAKTQFNIVKNILNYSIFSQNIIELILIQYWIFLPKQKNLLNWININNLDWSSLSENIKDKELLKNNFNKINWINLSQNPKAISILENNIDWTRLSSNIYIYILT